MAFEASNVPKALIGVFCAIIGLGAGYLANNYANDKEAAANTLRSENKMLKETETNLVNLENNKEQYIADTQKFNEESKQILEKFPTFMFLEDKILYADDMQKSEMAQFQLEEFTYGSSTYVMSTSYSDSSLMELYSVGCQADFNGLTYPKVKELINFGKNGESSQRFVLNRIEFAYNEETGYLAGEFSYNTYFIAGQEEPYEFDPSILELIGADRRIDDLFGTREGGDTDLWEDEYGDIVDDVIDDILEGEDFEVIEE